MGRTTADLTQLPAAGSSPVASTAELGPLLVTITTAAEMLCVGRTTIYELIWREELRPIRIGRSVRFSVEQLQEFVRRRSGAP